MKAILVKLNWWLYEKVKDYADSNGITVVGAIRMILTQFFRNNNNNI